MFSLQCQGIQQVELLKYKAQPLPAEPPAPGAGGRRCSPVQQDVPGADGVDGGDAVEQGGLPFARRPMMAINSPSSTSKLTRSSALVTLFLLP